METEEILREIGMKLRKVRIERGHTSYEKFCYEHGLSKVQYHNMEKGKGYNITSLIRVLKIHDLTLKEFFSL